MGERSGDTDDCGFLSVLGPRVVLMGIQDIMGHSLRSSTRLEQAGSTDTDATHVECGLALALEVVEDFIENGKLCHIFISAHVHIEYQVGCTE